MDINELKSRAGINENIPEGSKKMLEFFGVNDVREIGKSPKFSTLVKQMGFKNVIGYTVSGQDAAGQISIIGDGKEQTFDFNTMNSMRVKMFHSV